VQQLSGLDGAFLAMETASVFGHVGSVCIIDPTTSSVPVTLERLSELVGSRLPLVPPFCRRLAPVPFGLDQPYWIEDPDFDLEYHVREIALPAPGTDTMLAEQAARLHARPLDRARPLWEMYLISGLSGTGWRSTQRCTTRPSTVSPVRTSSAPCRTRHRSHARSRRRRTGLWPATYLQDEVQVRLTSLDAQRS